MSNQVVRATSDSGCVRSQYATESGRAARTSVYSDVAGGDPRDVGFRLVAAVEPRRVLEVGCGVGELAASVARELGADVTALDRSPRMVELAPARWVNPGLVDVQALPSEDETVDVVVPARILYHVGDLERRLSEISGVLAAGRAA